MFESIAILVTHSLFGPVAAGLVFFAPYYLRLRFFGEITSIHRRQSVVTSLGIFGTFIGIAGGLYLFDSSNITASVPELINGLKTAFFTSIAGILASIILQTKPSLYGKVSEEKEEEKTEKDILQEMIGEIKALNSAISGEGDASLSTLIGKMRADNNDNHKELRSSFNDFVKQMSENNTKALIEAVQKVMEDFNTKINDQLGDSFKELSDAVRNLVVWQGDYKNHIITTTQLLQEVQKSLKASSDSLTDTSNTVAKLAEDNTKLEQLHVSFMEVTEKLNETLGVTSDFSKNMTALARKLEGSGDVLQKEVREILDGTVKTIRTGAEETLQSMNNISQASIKKVQENSAENQKNLEETAQKTLASFGEKLASISEKLTSDFREIQKVISQLN